MSATVRISPETHAKLKLLAQETGEAMPVILDQAIETFCRQRFLAGINDDYARLRRDPKAWQEELDERLAWDVTTGDGQEDD